jgi:hypothetical protein
LRIERLLHRRRRPREDVAFGAVEQQHVALRHEAADVANTPEHRHAHRPRDDRDVRGQRPFFEDHALQTPLVVFEQFGGPEIARNQDRVLPQPHLRGGTHLARDDAEQPVRQVLQIVHPVGEQRIVDLAHALAGALLDALDRGFRGQAGVDRLVDAPRPTLVIGEHLVGLEHFDMLAADAEFGLARHPVDAFAHLVERRVDAVTLGVGVLGDGVLDRDPRLVIDREARAHAVHQLLPGDAHRRGRLRPVRAAAGGVDQAGIGDQFGQHHRDGLQRLDLDVRIFATVGVLDGQDPHGSLAADDGDARETVEAVLAGLGLVGEIGVAGGLVEVEHLDVLGDRSDKPLAEGQLGDVDCGLIKAAGGEQFEHALAQQVDRADLAVDRGGDDADDGVQLGLRGRARRHHVVKAGENFAGGGGGRKGHSRWLSDEALGCHATKAVSGRSSIDL